MSDITIEEYNDTSHRDIIDVAMYLLMDTTGMSIDEIINLEFGDFVYSLYDYLMAESLYPCDINEIFDHMQSFETMEGIWHVKNPETGKKVLRYNTTQSTLAILDYLKSSGQEFIYPDEPLFQCKYGGNISKYHIMNIFDEIEEPINTKDVNKMSFNFFLKKSLHWVMINKEIKFLQEGE